MNNNGGYLAATLGGAMGAVIVTTISVLGSEAYAQKFMPSVGLELLAIRAWSVFAGCWVGAVLGCWLGLNWQDHANANRTIAILAGLTPLGILLHWFLIIRLRYGVEKLEFWLLGGLILIALPLLARYWTNHF